MKLLKETTCKCIQDYECVDEINVTLSFHKGREYQVDIYPLFYKVYQNGSWYGYAWMDSVEFENSFLLID